MSTLVPGILLHAVIIWSAAALWWDPGDDLVRVLNITSLAVHAVRRIQADALPIRRGGIVEHFVNVGWTKILARTAELAHTPRLADVRVFDDQMCRLIFFVLCSRMIKVGKFVKSA